MKFVFLTFLLLLPDSVWYTVVDELNVNKYHKTIDMVVHLLLLNGS